MVYHLINVRDNYQSGVCAHTVEIWLTITTIDQNFNGIRDFELLKFSNKFHVSERISVSPRFQFATNLGLALVDTGLSDYKYRAHWLVAGHKLMFTTSYFKGDFHGN